MKLEALGDAPSFARLKCFVERAELVGVEVVRFRHPLLKTLNSISAMFSQLPCVGV